MSHLPHRRRAWLLGVLAPLLITAAAWAVIIPLLPRIPDPAAVHWDTSGVDRTGSVAELVTTMAVVSGLSVLVMGVFAVLTGRQAVTRRLTLGLAVGLATMFAGASLGTVAVQVDAPTATDAGSLNGWVLGSVLASLALGAAAAALAGSDPQQPAADNVPADAVSAPLTAGERAVWVTSVTALGPRGTPALVALAVLAWAGLWLLLDTALLVLLVILPVVVLMLVMTTWRVRVDFRGLSARGGFGWPRQHVPAAEVERADVVTVRPFAEFGGWGLRMAGDGTVGIVIRKGEAIAVQRTGGRRFVVTVDDAATGAALLNTYAQRARSTSDRLASSD